MLALHKTQSFFTNEISEVFRPAADDLQRLCSQILVGGSENMYIRVPPTYWGKQTNSLLCCSSSYPYSHPIAAVILAIICFLLSMVGRKEHGALCWAAKAGISPHLPLDEAF